MSYKPLDYGEVKIAQEKIENAEKDNKQPNEAMQRDWSMREIKETEYQELLSIKEKYDQIMSADSNEAMKALNIISKASLDKREVQYKFYECSEQKLKEHIKNLENLILQVQAKEQELAEYKKSDESKEMSSMDYYNEMKEYKRELAKLKEKVMEYFKVKNMEDISDKDFEHLENITTEEEVESALEMIMESVESYAEYEEKLEQELKELCKGSELK